MVPSSDLLSSLMDMSFWHSVLMAASPNNSIQQLHEVSCLTLTVFINNLFLTIFQKPDLCLKIVNAAVKHLGALVEEPVSHLCREEEELIMDADPNLLPYWNQMQFRQRVSQVSTCGISHNTIFLLNAYIFVYQTLQTQILPSIDFDIKSLRNCSWSDVIKKFSAFCKNLPVEPARANIVFRWY